MPVLVLTTWKITSPADTIWPLVSVALVRNRNAPLLLVRSNPKRSINTVAEAPVLVTRRALTPAGPVLVKPVVVKLLFPPVVVGVVDSSSPELVSGRKPL